MGPLVGPTWGHANHGGGEVLKNLNEARDIQNIKSIRPSKVFDLLPSSLMVLACINFFNILIRQ